MIINTSNDISDNIAVTTKDNITKIEIKENCSLMLFYYEITTKLSKELRDQINMSSIFNNSKVNKKTLYVINQNDNIYNISFEVDSNNNIIYENLFISEKSNNSSKFIETTLKILPNNNYTVTKKDTASITNGFKIYMKNKEEQKKFIEENKHDMNIKFTDEFVLSKKQAFRSINDILGTLKKVDNINNIVSINELYKRFGVIPHREHIPIIRDDSIYISYYDTDNNEDEFYIVLNKTKEIVGKILIGYDNSGVINNIDYEIYKEFQEKRIEIRALKMLRVLLEENNIFDNEILNKLPKSTEKDANRIISINKPVQKVKK